MNQKIRSIKLTSSGFYGGGFDGFLGGDLGGKVGEDKSAKDQKCEHHEKLFGHGVIHILGNFNSRIVKGFGEDGGLS